MSPASSHSTNATPSAPSASGAAAPGPRIPLLDLARSIAPLREELLAAMARVVDSACFLHGPEVQTLEHAIAELCGVKEAVACASGSDALLLALMALGIGDGDEVIVPSFTFFATASAVWRLGARPVFVDIDPHTFNLDPQRVEDAITPLTRAIIPVHLFGQCADMAAIDQIARRWNLFVIEDAAQAIAARFEGRAAGSLGTVAAFSFYPTKNLGGFGDGGLLTTSDAVLARDLRLLAAHGMSPRYYHQVVGINSRLDSLQAAVLCVKLAHLPAWTMARQANARRYEALLRAAGLEGRIVLPQTDPRCEHVWNQYTIRIRGGVRDAVKARLAALGVGTEVYYPVPLHLQKCFQPLGYGPGSLPHTEQAAREVLSLPIYPELTPQEQAMVVDRLAQALAMPHSQAA